MAKQLKGKVVSDKMNKTAVVEVRRFFKHPKYKKYIRKTKRYKAHDENNKSKIGEEVMIQECRPLSKEKKWRIVPGSQEVKSS
ncbi:MAG: 30S ribosomal protein S17 [Patescibacteria group bacterium]